MAALQSSLIVSMIDRVTKPAGRISQSLRGITGIGTGNLGLISGGLGRIAAAVGGIYAIQRAVTGSISAAMDFESAMADVAKVVDFPTPTAFKQFQSNVIDMSKHLPMAADDLSRIVAAAGQAGIANADLLKFTELAAKVGVAFDISADTAGDSLAKMMTALDMSVDDVGKLADAMNHLSNSQASSASGILEFFRRAGADGKMFGFTAEQTSAFGSAMLSAGAEAEVAATSFRNMGKALGKGGAATKAQRIAFKALGLNAKTTAKMMHKDAVGTTLKVLEAINKLPKYQQAAVASQLFGDEARALMPLITNLDLLKKSLGMVSNESQYLGSASREYERRAQTFANDVQLFKNNLTALEIAIGNRLMPILSDAMKAIAPYVDKLANLFNTLDQRVSIFDKIGAAISGFMDGLGLDKGTKVADLFGKTLDSVFGEKITNIDQVATQLMSISGKFREFGAALKSFHDQFPTLSDNLGTLVGYGFELFVAAAGISMAAGAVKIIGNVLLTLTGVKTAAGILRAVAGLGRAAPGLKATASALEKVNGQVRIASRMKMPSVLGTILGYGGTAYSMLSDQPTDKAAAEDRIKRNTGWVPGFENWWMKNIGTPRSWIGLGQATTNSGSAQRAALDDATKSWPEAARMGMDAYVEALQAGGSVAESYAATVAEDITRQLAIEGRVDIDTTALERALSLARQFAATTGGSPVPAATTPVAGARAAGGPVEFGKIYKVGERGAELFTPGADGYISPNSAYRQAGAGGRVVHVGGITINLGMVGDGRSMRDVAEDLGQRIRDALDGAFADGTV